MVLCVLALCRRIDLCSWQLDDLRQLSCFILSARRWSTKFTTVRESTLRAATQPREWISRPVRLPGPGRSDNLACLAACKILGTAQALRANEGRARRLEAHEGGVQAATGTSALYLSEEDWIHGGGRDAGPMGLAPPATGTLAVLPPLAQWAMSPSRGRSADKLLGKCNVRFRSSARLWPGSISAAQTQPKGNEEPNAASIHPHAVPGTASGDEEQPRRARARKQPTQATVRPGNTSDAERR